MTDIKKLTLEEIKQIEVMLLKHVANICEEHNIRYFLIYGTLLGAVRHQGFIPWDDDIDIYMPRPDYERFIAIWKEKVASQISDVKLLIPLSDVDYYYEYAKLIAINTICVINQPIKKIDGLGIWIDIFPLDAMPDNYKYHFYRLNIFRRMRSLSVYTEVPKIRSVKTFCVYIGWKMVKIVGWKFFHKKVLKLSSKYNYETSKYVACAVLASKVKYVYPRAYFDNAIQLSFEENMFAVPFEYHKILKQTYGDYMKLPPLKERVSLHSFDAYYK